MSDLVSSAVAIFGTLAGTTTAYAFAERSKARERRTALEASSRQERLSIYSEFIAAVSDFRRAKIDEWHADNERPNEDHASSARRDVVRTRVSIRTALARVQLTARPSTDDTLLTAAFDAAAHADQLGAELGADEFAALRQASLDSIDRFTRAAADAARPT